MSGRGYKWADAEPGNLLALRHGARSERLVSAKADELLAALVEAAPWVSELDASAVQRYVRAEARAVMLSDHIERVGAADPAGVPNSLWDSSTRADLAAAQLAGALGLDPVSRARLLRDLGVANRASAEASSLRDLMAKGAVVREAASARLATMQNTSKRASGVVDAPNGHSDDSTATSNETHKNYREH